MFPKEGDSESNVRARPHHEPSMVAVMPMTEEELETIMANFANEDSSYDKTWTRIVVEKFLGKVHTARTSEDLSMPVL